MKILLGGEGPNELGSWARAPAYRDEEASGVIEELLRKVRREGWRVEDGILWKQIVKYRAGGHRTAETRNVLGLVLEAKEKGCYAVAFVRDRDGTHAHPNEERRRAVEQGIRDARQEFGEDCPAIIGGVAVKKLESWLIALRGGKDSETIRRPKEHLAEAGITLKSTADYVAVVQAADIDALPADASSLRLWLQRASEALDPPV